MTEQFPFPSDGKRYYTWNRYLRDLFGHKVFKVALDAGFDCPNRDGTVAFGGCTFCSAAGSGDFAGNKVDPIDVQFAKLAIKCIKNGRTANIWRISKLIQATCPACTKEKFKPLAQEGVVGMSIATRLTVYQTTL